MGKKARDHRARIRRDNRYLDGRAKPEDDDIHAFGWNRSRVRNLRKWEKHREQLLMDDETYENWLFFGLWRPLKKGG